ncbi:MAG: multidrug ABC transporter ATP-binding protein, partial [Delftia sp.]|nr:multidrug ABC transporter ATP-binding protein [Delftia sp.]
LARRKTVILTTHNMDEAERLADRIAIIDHGQLLVLDTPQALKSRVGEGDVVEIGLSAPLDEEAAGRAQTALKSLVSHTWPDVEHDLLTVRALNAVSALPAILNALQASGLQAAEVRVRENTLEDVFIQLTGRRLRQ